MSVEDMDIGNKDIGDIFITDMSIITNLNIGYYTIMAIGVIMIVVGTAYAMWVESKGESGYDYE